MCFSAGASFTAATALATAGYFSVRKTESRRQLPFASIPYLFAVQQFAEGVFWLTSGGSVSPMWESPAILIFLVFAQVVWPFWIPLSVYVVETVKQRKRLLTLFLIIGIGLATYHLYCLLVYPVHAYVSGYHVEYSLNFPLLSQNITGPFYVLVTILPLFISSVNRMNVLGVAIAASFVITYFFYTQYLISVWCFFAAVISGIVLWILSDRVVTVRSLLQ